MSARQIPLEPEIENGELAGGDVLKRHAYAVYGDPPLLAVLGDGQVRALVGRIVGSPTVARRPDRAA
ncbi:hypothetical protein ACVGOW_27340 [Pseudonocardia saturnea]